MYLVIVSDLFCLGFIINVKYYAKHFMCELLFQNAAAAVYILTILSEYYILSAFGYSVICDNYAHL